MAVYSMTGYATASVAPADRPESPRNADHLALRETLSGGVEVSLELRSVNSRFLDLAFRLPDEFRGVEPALRDLLNGAFRRGKIELRLNARQPSGSAWPEPMPAQLNQLARLESTVQGWLPKAQGFSVHQALQWCQGAAVPLRLDGAVLEAAGRCIRGLREARGREGARLSAVLAERVARLRELASRVEPLIPQVVDRQQRRFLERWRAALDLSGDAEPIAPEARHERALHEAAAYAVRIDVAEELARLRTHLDEFDRLLGVGGELGKRLDFLVQELLREANTLASKAAAIELTQLALEMKIVIEQLREQVQNLE